MFYKGQRVFHSGQGGNATVIGDTIEGSGGALIRFDLPIGRTHGSDHHLWSASIELLTLIGNTDEEFE